MEKEMTYKFSADWFTHNANNFLAAKKVLPTRNRILEIGSFEGLSAVWLTKNMLDEGGTLVCIDTWLGGEEHKAIGMDLNIIEERFDHNHELLAIEEPSKTVIKKKGRSATEVAKQIADGAQFDFIYVDGGHTALDCITDAVMCWEVLKPGGVMILDDYGWQDRPVGPLHPKPGIDAFLNFFYADLTVLFMNYQVAVQKKT
jgi:predicted O-methyltransferase YrrM